MEKAVHLIPGMTVRVSLVTETEAGSNGHGAFISLGTTKQYNGKTYTLTQGYAVEKTDVGSLEIIEGEPSVLYTHHKPEKNVIYFWSHDEGVSSISIVGVPIHDHSSIIQGGPSFGTYFTDDEVV